MLGPHLVPRTVFSTQILVLLKISSHSSEAIEFLSFVAFFKLP